MVLPKMSNEAVEKLLKGLNMNTLWGHSILPDNGLGLQRTPNLDAPP